ncbi:MAG: hypothetical protein RLZZ297_1372 [Chloroflexota bacterium]
MRRLIPLVLSMCVIAASVVWAGQQPISQTTAAEPRNSYVSMIALGLDHSCAILPTAKLKCWGTNGDGQLGLGTTADMGNDAGEMGSALPYVNVAQTVKYVSGGNRHTCAIRADNSTVCWGFNGDGELGLGHVRTIGDGAGEMGSALVSVDFGTGLYATSLSASYAFTCAVLNTKQVKCWGYQDSGELGVSGQHGLEPNTMGANLPAVDLGTGAAAVSVVTGFQHACALLNNAKVKCWGLNSNGQLGYGDTTNRVYPNLGDLLPVVNVGTGRTVKALAAGGNFTCAIRDNGTVVCWGYNGTGQLGIGSTTDIGDGADEMGDALTAVDLGSGRTAVAIAASRRMDRDLVCVVLDNATLKCWGANDIGQLGTGDMLDRGDAAGEMAGLEPVNLGSGITVKAVSMGNAHTCVTLATTNIKCFGHGAYGKLGYGNTTNYGSTAELLGAAIPVVDLASNVSSTSTRTKSPTKTRTPTKSKTLTKSKTRTKTKTPTKSRTLTRSRTATKTQVPTTTPSVVATAVTP